jgi:hypothetical protein
MGFSLLPDFFSVSVGWWFGTFFTGESVVNLWLTMVNLWLIMVNNWNNNIYNILGISIYFP